MSLSSAIAGLLLAPNATIALAGSILAAAMCLGYVVINIRALREEVPFACNCLPGLTEVVSIGTVIRAVVMFAAAVVGMTGPATGITYGDPDAAIPAASTAIALIGLPLATYLAALCWRSYRDFMAGVDWVWVLAARKGLVATPLETRDDYCAS